MPWCHTDGRPAVTSLVAPCSAMRGPEATLSTCELLAAFLRGGGGPGGFAYTVESILGAIRRAAESLEYFADRAGSVRDVVMGVDHYSGAMHVVRDTPLTAVSPCVPCGCRRR
jgi:hypothetical protein